MRKLIYGTMPPQVENPTLAKIVSIGPYTRNDMLHMMSEMEYIMPMIRVPKMYYLMHRFLICLQIGVTPPMFGGHITYSQFLFMWAINNLEWREYLTYNIVCYYI
jgi:hypothetical protein